MSFPQVMARRKVSALKRSSVCAACVRALGYASEYTSVTVKLPNSSHTPEICRTCDTALNDDQLLDAMIERAKARAVSEREPSRFTNIMAAFEPRKAPHGR